MGEYLITTKDGTFKVTTDDSAAPNPTQNMLLQPGQKMPDAPKAALTNEFGRQIVDAGLSSLPFLGAAGATALAPPLAIAGIPAWLAGGTGAALAAGAGGSVSGLLEQGARKLLGVDAPESADDAMSRAARSGVEQAGAEAGGRLAGGLLQKVAVPFASSALGIRALDNARGVNPGLAVLQETRGVLPATVQKSARNKIGLLSGELENAYKGSPNLADLQDALDVVEQRIAREKAANNPEIDPRLYQMRQWLTEAQSGFAGRTLPSGAVDRFQPPFTLLEMKRMFGDKFANFNPLNPKDPVQDVARAAYGAMDRAGDAAVPGTAALNDRMAALIPAADRAEAAALKAGITQNVLHRVAAHTGALTAAMHMGPVGLLVPEIASLPATKMAVARGLFKTGRAVADPLSRAALYGASRGLLGAVDDYRDYDTEQKLFGR